MLLTSRFRSVKFTVFVSVQLYGKERDLDGREDFQNGTREPWRQRSDARAFVPAVWCLHGGDQGLEVSRNAGRDVLDLSERRSPHQDLTDSKFEIRNRPSYDFESRILTAAFLQYRRKGNLPMFQQRRHGIQEEPNRASGPAPANQCRRFVSQSN